jgi:hypothetical protein
MNPRDSFAKQRHYRWQIGECCLAIVGKLLPERLEIFAILQPSNEAFTVVVETRL